MSQRAVVAGTGFDGRAQTIRRYYKAGSKITLRREPYNAHDENAIAVYVMVPRMGGLFGHTLKQIGYIKKHTARGLSKKMESGIKIRGTIHRLFTSIKTYNPDDDYEVKSVVREHPKVVLDLDW